MGSKPDGGLISVDRALQILELLGDHRSIRVMDVAEYLGVARSTAHRLLQALVARQFVVQDGARLYYRGPAFLAAGFGNDRVLALRAVAHSHLEKLSGTVTEDCRLAVLEGNGARVIDGVGSRQVMRVGLVLPAHVTAAGKALLAELSEAEFLSLYPVGLPGTPTEAGKRTALRQELAMVRRRGYATNLGENTKGVTAAAVALKNAHGRAMASIAVVCPSARYPQVAIERLAEHLRNAASAIEKSMGEADLPGSGARNEARSG